MFRPRFFLFLPVPILLLLFIAWRPGTTSRHNLREGLRQTWSFVLPYNQSPAFHSSVEGAADSLKQNKHFTTSPSCPTTDGQFFLSRHNFTYQIQCATRYTAETLTFDEIVIDLRACVNQCDSYNHDPGEDADYCVGATFFDVPVSRMGSCTTYSEIEGVRTGGNIPMTQQSVLLIGGPGGMVAVEVRPDLGGSSESHRGRRVR